MKKNSQYYRNPMGGGLIKNATITIFLMGILNLSNQNGCMTNAIILQQQNRHRMRLHTFAKDDDDNNDELAQTNSEEGSDEQKEKKKKQSDEEKKFAETMTLMSKYDKAEAHAKWLASPEYAQMQRDKEQKETQSEVNAVKQAQQDKENEGVKEKEDAERALYQKEKDVRDLENKNKKDESFKKKTISKYLTKLTEDSNDKIITKDRAFIAAGKFIEKFKNLHARKKSQYLDTNFKSTWSKYDEKHVNYIMQGDADQFMEDILGNEVPQDESNVEQSDELQEM